ncbi:MULTISPECIES: helical backbone metal receptor [unclassified Spirosoma]|uniref:helical backbone metal receptor n=1 Tax=unclassified Spirosoma TaxID=2621999 RepID=UPI00095DBE7B|nr:MULTISPECIES: helical backbone metal receptor [unclassified Spirosoma]MBN8823626.1 ABC transporter substrate-binding protein [Spirosoma sp.]OJW76815.1 MAG: cobalamin-binding protein [Spirosoma sp. 48-14]
MSPQRIVSLVPSQTELLFDLGLDSAIVGITKFCIHPANKVTSKTIVGGTKTLNNNKIRDLYPDLILANKEENSREQIEELQQHYQVHVTDVVTVSDALAMIREVGTLVGKTQEATDLAQQIADRLCPVPDPSVKRVAYLIWRNPYMVAAEQTFIHSMLAVAGFSNAFSDRLRYPEIAAYDIQTARPDLIFLSSEPYPFAEKHIAELQAICPNARVVLVDGELFSWYGSRLLRSSDYFRNLRTELAASKP